MSELALERIQENIDKYNRGEDASFLDLGKCGITEIPEELGACIWLKKLNFSYNWWEFHPEELDWVEQRSHNSGTPNEIYSLAPCLSKLINLEHLIISHTNISDLTLLGNLTKLQSFSCSYTSVSDLSPLSNLTNLIFIDCSSTQVADLYALQGLSCMQILLCYYTKISDLRPLSSLVNLHTIQCYNTAISNLEPLAKLSNLQILWCSDTAVSDFSPIANMTNIRSLSISSTETPDLSPLANLINLEYLYCRMYYLSDLSALVNLINLKFLYVSGNKVADLTPIANMIKLQVLHCNNTQVFDLKPLANLNNLKVLHCYSSQVSDLSPLTHLKHLEILRCSDTLTLSLAPLSSLSNLRILSCENTQINNLLPLENLDNIKILNFSNTTVSDLTPLSNLSKLQNLSFHQTEVYDLTPLINLESIQELSCRNSKVSNLAPLSSLYNLESLDCSNTSVSDLTPLSTLRSLRWLYCSDTLISDLTPLAKLDYLEKIYCYNTLVSDLSQLMYLTKKNIAIKWSDHHDIIVLNREVSDKLSISLLNTPLITPPLEVAQKSPEAVNDYFEELGHEGSKLNEVKIIFIGEASAGKTSLVKCLLEEDFDNAENQTHGIRIRKAPFQMDDGDIVTAHFWDFGGQEIMHATHQFFLSQRCIYVLLLNSRNDDQAEKWLKHATSFGGKSPILVILNKIDENPSYEVNRKNLLDKYPTIRDFYRVSVRTRAGIELFRQALQREINDSTTRSTRFPDSWFKVKEYFSNMEADYIETSKYREVCRQSGVIRQFSQDVLLQFLHDLGVVINFQNLKYFDTQILNPLWLTNGVYRIINSELVANAGGILQESEFEAVINDSRYYPGNTTDQVIYYPNNKLHYIVRVMEEFELCFELKSRTYVIPQLLPVQEPEFRLDGALLHLVVSFPNFMPNSLFPRLMVKLHGYIYNDIRWRTGMVLQKSSIFQATGKVIWDKEDKKISINTVGNDRRRLLSFIRETIKEIADSFTDLEFEEYIPIPSTAKDMIRYSTLVKMEAAGKKVVFSEELGEDIPLADLLDGIEDASMREKSNKLPIKGFISYSHKDSMYLGELKSALSPLVRLERLELWDDQSIDAGDEWEKIIFDNLKNADIVLCLISADFIASSFCYNKEFETALLAHQRKEKTIIPIMLRKTDWEGLPLAAIQGCPGPGEWITSADNKDEAWAKVSQTIRTLIDNIREIKKRSDIQRVPNPN